jgi:DNA-binding response OmpR family regulator
VLVVEDNEADVLLIRDAILTANPAVMIDVLKDGDKAVRFFDKIDANSSMQCPALVVRDINLPKRHGSEVLKYMRHSELCRDALVVIVSTSGSARDHQQMTELGANGYFKKPSEYDAFMNLGNVVNNLLTGNHSE